MRRILIIIMALFYGCGYNDFADIALDIPDSKPANITISELKEFYANGGVTTFSRDYFLECRVTTDDRSGNFFRSLFIEDATGGIEVKMGLYELYSLYPLGRKLSISLKGVTLGMYDGVYQLGIRAPKGSGYEIDYFGHQAVVDKFIVRGDIKSISPTTITIPNLTDQLTGKLLTIKNLSITGGGEETWGTSAENSPTGKPIVKNLEAKDNNGNAILITTSGYADFVNEKSPGQIVAITGILRKVNKKYTLSIRDLNDVHKN